jgi:hypothetical protein
MATIIVNCKTIGAARSRFIENFYDGVCAAAPSGTDYLVPGLCPGTRCMAGSACRLQRHRGIRSESRQSLEGSAFPGGARERDARWTRMHSATRPLLPPPWGPLI